LPARAVAKVEGGDRLTTNFDGDPRLGRRLRRTGHGCEDQRPAETCGDTRAESPRVTASASREPLRRHGRTCSGHPRLFFVAKEDAGSHGEHSHDDF
jgi:hypothetical protein